MGFVFGGQPCQEPSKIAQYLTRDSAFTLVKDWHGNANRFACPLGDKPGRGMVLLTQEQLESINIWTSTAIDLVVTDNLRKLTIKNLVPLKAYCVTPGSSNDMRRVFALEITDPRYFLHQKLANAAYNVKIQRADDTIEYIDETTSDGLGTAWTWDEIGDELWTAMGVSDAWPGWPFSPDSVPEGWHFWQVPAVTAFQAVARRLGCSLRWHPFTGAYDVVQLGADDAAFDASVESFRANDRLWDEDWQEPWPHQVPESVRVVFRRTKAEATGNPYYDVDVAFPDTDISGDAVADTMAVVIDDLMYTGANAAACATRADERADDYARIVRYFNNNIYRHYRGVGTPDDVFLGSLCSCVIWQDVGEGTHTVIDHGALEPIDWSNYLHGIGEVMIFSECVAGNIENTYNEIWSKPLRLS